MASLTWAERLILWNQYEILKNQAPGMERIYEEYQEIVESGYEGFYPGLNDSITEKTVPSSATDEVVDILNMFRAIKHSCSRLAYVPKSPHAEFKGFDGNNHHPQFGIAMFLRRTRGLWDELKSAPDNSHTISSLDRYRLMLREWERLGREHDLTADEIEAIADAK